MFELGTVVEGPGAASSRVVLLVANDEAPRLDVALQTAHGARPDDTGDPELLHRPHVGPKRHLVRRKLMFCSVARQEGNIGAPDCSNHQWRRRRPIRRCYFDLVGILEKLVEARTTKHPDQFFHPLESAPSVTGPYTPKLDQVNDTILGAVAFIGAYLIGSIDFAVHVSRRMGIDIYEHGSGNPGTSNVFRILGKKAAGVVLLGDLLKGVGAAALGATLVGDTVGFACAFAATVGHVAPVWHRFRGGRGVATAIGGAIWLEPVLGLILALAWVGVVVGTKTASVASLGAMVIYVPLFLFAGHRGWSIFWAALTAALVVWRHKDNISRILSRSENRVTT